VASSTGPVSSSVLAESDDSPQHSVLISLADVRR
jgi:hypothetical protein